MESESIVLPVTLRANWVSGSDRLAGAEVRAELRVKEEEKCLAEARRSDEEVN